MAIQHKSRVRETASNKPNTSTAFNLPRSAATGYRTFYAAITNGNQCPYFATNGTDWESGMGTFASGSPDTLTRTTIYESSTGSAIDWSSGANVDIFIEWPSTLGDYFNSVGLVSIATNGLTSQSLSGGTSKLSSALATESVDEMGWWDHTNKKFQPTRAGIFYIQGWVQFKNVTAGQFEALLYKNGSVEISGPVARANSSDYPLVSVNGHIRLNGSSDYVELYVYCGTTESTNEQSGSCGFKAIWEAP